MSIEGSADPGFERVADVFARTLTEQAAGGGGACCVYLGERKVVDLWGGLADPSAGRAWAEDTLVLVFSATKGVTAICAHLLVERGVLELDVPVTRYWPEFARGGKETVTVRHLLAHQAGLPVIEAPLGPADLLAWTPPVDALARQEPLWPPGSRHGYHAMTFGWLVGEVVRRASGRSVGELLADALARPLGLDVWIGLPPAEDHRVARLLAPREPVAAATATPLLERAMNPSKPPLNFNKPAVRAAQLPGANAIATARALAKLYAAVIGSPGVEQVISPRTLHAAIAEQTCGPDLVSGLESRFGSGFMLPSAAFPMSGPRAFGHPGAGGSLAFADLDRHLAFAYVTNQMRSGMTEDPRCSALVEALLSCLGR